MIGVRVKGLIVFKILGKNGWFRNSGRNENLSSLSALSYNTCVLALALALSTFAAIERGGGHASVGYPASTSSSTNCIFSLIHVLRQCNNSTKKAICLSWLMLDERFCNRRNLCVSPSTT